VMSSSDSGQHLAERHSPLDRAEPTAAMADLDQYSRAGRAPVGNRQRQCTAMPAEPAQRARPDARGDELDPAHPVPSDKVTVTGPQARGG